MGEAERLKIGRWEGGRHRNAEFGMQKWEISKKKGAGRLTL